MGADVSLDILTGKSVQVDGPLDTPCLVWTGVRLPRGYGVVKVGGRTLRVHRVAWIERNGPIPPETPHVLHRCDNPPCWAEGHLFLGTHADNMADMSAKGRGRSGHGHETHCPQGHPYDEANTYLDSRNIRHCRTCNRADCRRRYALRRGAPA
jgi:hypothetical protein